ncbi:hypothetical protein BJV82DRAFT_92245 [Fennellomyces sp. T-0311]|nr:hypothetical protein BJV82DRAFT_92245 [Fennellomyces sp. T-0311]
MAAVLMADLGHALTVVFGLALKYSYTKRGEALDGTFVACKSKNETGWGKLCRKGNGGELERYHELSVAAVVALLLFALPRSISCSTRSHSVPASRRIDSILRRNDMVAGETDRCSFLSSLGDRLRRTLDRDRRFRDDDDVDALRASCPSSSSATRCTLRPASSSSVGNGGCSSSLCPSLTMRFAFLLLARAILGCSVFVESDSPPLVVPGCAVGHAGGATDAAGAR